jgi:hypothetical protein
MQLVLDEEDLSRLKPDTLADLLGQLAGKVPEGGPPASATLSIRPQGRTPEGRGFGWTGVVDLTRDQVVEFMKGAPGTEEGLRVLAEHGPVIRFDQLRARGIDDVKRWQADTTKRVRTVTGHPRSWLLSWWDEEEKYAVTHATHRALREYFGVATE